MPKILDLEDLLEAINTNAGRLNKFPSTNDAARASAATIVSGMYITYGLLRVAESLDVIATHLSVPTNKQG